jgi:hypothetical protein
MKIWPSNQDKLIEFTWSKQVNCWCFVSYDQRRPYHRELVQLNDKSLIEQFLQK